MDAIDQETTIVLTSSTLQSDKLHNFFFTLVVLSCTILGTIYVRVSMYTCTRRLSPNNPN